jgi:DNA mismatch endonuclease, patch repair protein
MARNALWLSLKIKRGAASSTNSSRMDKLTPERRSENMRRIRSKDTGPELFVRRMVRELGFTGYRLHRTDIPGKPDLVWVGKKTAIFVHGCFWHGHDCDEGIRKPKSNLGYWIPKLQRNSERDQARQEELLRNGWKILVLWDCELKAPDAVKKRLREFLKSSLKSSRRA